MIGNAFLSFSVNIFHFNDGILLTTCCQTWTDFLTYPASQGVIMDYVSDRYHALLLLLFNNFPNSMSTRSLATPNCRVLWTSIFLCVLHLVFYQLPCLICTQFACTISSTLTSFASSNLYKILGEWSNAPTDCAKWLNGRGVGARWDGTWWNNNQVFGSCTNWTGDSSGFSDDYTTFLRK
jgi:hypothetical protein